MPCYTLCTPHVISEEAAGETVVINLETGSYYNLNAHASALWALLAAGLDSDALLAACPGDAAKEQARHFLDRLAGEGLIRESRTAVPLPEDLRVSWHELDFQTFTDMQELLGLDPIHEADESAGWPLKKEANA